MPGLGRHSETEIECPFCGKGKIIMYHQEGYLQAKTSRISAGAKQTFHRVNDKYDNSDIEFVPEQDFHEMTPTDLLSRDGYNMNRSSTRVNERRGISMKIDKPSFRSVDRIRMGQKVKTNW